MPSFEHPDTPMQRFLDDLVERTLARGKRPCSSAMGQHWLGSCGYGRQTTRQISKRVS